MSNAKLQVLTPRNSQLIIIDHQPRWPSASSRWTARR